MTANVLIFVQLFVYLHQIIVIFKIRYAIFWKYHHSGKALATVTVVQNRCHCLAVLHSLLCPVLRSDAITHQCCGKGRFMDSPLWVGQDLSVWGIDDSGC